MNVSQSTLLAIATSAGTALAQPMPQAPLRNGLSQAAKAAEPAELLPVVIVMREQTPQAQIDAAASIQNKAARRTAVTTLLRQTAHNTQGEVLDVLIRAQALGLVGDRVRPLWISNMIAANVSPALLDQLAQRNDIAYIHLDKSPGEDIFPVEPGDGTVIDGGITTAITCGITRINAPDVWNMGFDGAGITVAMVDSGLCIAHTDIVNNVWINQGEIAGNNIDDDNNGYVDDVNGWSFEQNSNNISDPIGHGTHTAGTVAGDGTSGEQTGVAPSAKIMMLKISGSFNGESAVWEAMQYSVANNAQVLSASIGWPHSVGPDRAMWRQVSDNTFAAGVATVYAAGNEGTCCGVDSVRTPGDVPDMITAGATDCNDSIASFSSRGPVTWENVSPYFDWPLPDGKMKPTISAPGVDTLSLNVCSGYTFSSGTSMATPHTAGTMALMLQANPNLDHFQIKQILKDTAIDLGQSGPDNTYGHGRIDALAAVEMALSMNGCDADLDGDGDADADDFFDYLDAFAIDDLAICDIDEDGDCDADDFFDYLDQFAAGC